MSLLDTILGGIDRIAEHLKCGKDINEQDLSPEGHGRTLLHFAVLNDDAHSVKYLISHGADNQLRDYDGLTPIRLVCTLHQLEAVCKNTDDLASDIDVVHRGIDAVRAFIEKRDVIKYVDTMPVLGCNRSLLHEAASANLCDIATFLLDNNADPNSRSSLNQTPLYEASQMGHIEMVRLLLSRGADAAIRNIDGYSPLDRAKTPNIVEALINHCI